ncbi:hypothetical protein [Paraburkholderia diazotrophica]|uniref:Putative spermidine/putrescine transport system permease protein n=1 Tax=Paraburkholderia diazotrophica TaxID=667676 RepID=A0A1H7ECJ2_9BURK|nr:putative spermidine/putrescine transport system permease protein [Paraburkholderia diazotrophica]
MRILRIPAAMPGRLTGLLATIVLFLATLPILTTITMPFGNSDAPVLGSSACANAA